MQNRYLKLILIQMKGGDNMNKIRQIISAHFLLAVIRYRESFQAVHVQMFQLVESFEPADDGKHSLKRYVTGIVCWQGKLCEAEQVEGFLGYANGEHEAEHLGLKAMSEEQREHYWLARSDSVPCSFSEMTRLFEARYAKSDQQIIVQCVN